MIFVKILKKKKCCFFLQTSNFFHLAMQCKYRWRLYDLKYQSITRKWLINVCVCIYIHTYVHICLYPPPPLLSINYILLSFSIRTLIEGSILYTHTHIHTYISWLKLHRTQRNSLLTFSFIKFKLYNRNQLGLHHIYYICHI